MCLAFLHWKSTYSLSRTCLMQAALTCKARICINPCHQAAGTRMKKWERTWVPVIGMCDKSCADCTKPGQTCLASTPLPLLQFCGPTSYCICIHLIPERHVRRTSPNLSCNVQFPRSSASLSQACFTAARYDCSWLAQAQSNSICRPCCWDQRAVIGVDAGA